MRCPRCLDEYEPHVTACATCGVPLVALDAPVAPAADARLGRFHPLVAAQLTGVLEQRRIAHRLVPHDDGVEVLVDEDWRDDLRAELALGWAQVVHAMDEDQAREVLALGGSAPGWYDAPRGGYVDRAGRTILDVADGEEEARDAGRMVGPAMATIGGVLLLLGWYADAGSLVVVSGLGLAIVGLLLPR
ncbi:hypothetical protein FTX61_07850 [Nitriliruptoraceae bacterium ZYF776]|nr:hypothetical protein [Profundirhabdus halotolerans]